MRTLPTFGIYGSDLSAYPTNSQIAFENLDYNKNNYFFSKNIVSYQNCLVEPYRLFKNNVDLSYKRSLIKLKKMKYSRTKFKAIVPHFKFSFQNDIGRSFSYITKNQEKNARRNKYENINQSYFHKNYSSIMQNNFSYGQINNSNLLSNHFSDLIIYLLI